MPAVFRHKGYRYHFYSNEGIPREPIHVHVLKDGIDAKFWLWPEVELVYNDGFTARDLREMYELISNRRQMITNAWNEHFGDAD